MSSKHTRIAASIFLSRIAQSRSDRTGYGVNSRTKYVVSPRPSVIERFHGENAEKLTFVRAHYRRRKGCK